MLTIKEFKAKYVRTFSDLHIKFKTGTIGIFGPNGSGKSTLLNLMRGTLTNDFKTFYGPRERMISDFAGKHDASYAEVLAESNGTRFLLRRSFPTGNVLTIGNDKPITKEGDIAEALKTLGINADLISLAGFIPQNKIAQFMSATDTERAKAYQILVSAEFIEQVWKRLGTFITAKQQINGQFVDTDTTLIDQNKTMEEDLESTEGKLAKAQESKGLWSAAELATARQRLASIESARLLKKQYSAARSKLEGAETDYNNAEAALRKLQGPEDVDESQLQSSLDRHRKQLKAWRAWADYQGQLQSTKENLKSLKGHIAQWRKKQKTYVDPNINLAMTQEAIGAAQALVNSSKTKLTAWTKAKAGECDACGQKITKEQLSKQIVDTTQQKEAAEKMLVDLRAKVTKKTAADQLKRELDTGKRELQQAAGVWLASKKSLLAAKAEKPGKIAELKAIKPAMKAAIQSLKTARSQRDALQKARTSVAQTKAYFQGAEVARDEAKARYLPVKDLLVEGAKEQLEADIRTQEEKKEAIIRHQASIASIRKQIEKNHATIARNAVERARWQRSKDSVEVLQVVRDKLHRDQLPKALAEKAQVFLTEGINERLERYGDKFWAEPGEDLSFVLNFPDREPKNSAELSIGQQVVLALSFWDTVADFFGLGIQAFDEPTANLDAENIGYLRDVLTVMTDSSRGRRQVFVVSHESALKASFQQVVEL